MPTQSGYLDGLTHTQGFLEDDVSPNFQTSFMRSLLQSPDNVKTVSISRCARRLCSQSVNSMIDVNSDRSSSCLTRTYWQDTAIHGAYYPFLCANTRNLLYHRIDNDRYFFLRWSCNDPFSRLRRMTAHGLIQSHNEPTNTVARERDSRLMFAYHRLRGLMPDMMTPTSRECAVTELSIQDDDCYDSLDNESVPALIE
jgi:hypothetical protein